MAFAGFGGSGELQHVGQTGRVENRRGLIPDFLHQKADAAGFLSWQSSHFSYAVLLAHGNGASGPSSILITWPTEI
jgi:hypothetical protein